ncbi:MAG: DUF4185 domain-containing protein [Candidatus Sericytochromatia bacterium]
MTRPSGRWGLVALLTLLSCASQPSRAQVRLTGQTDPTRLSGRAPDIESHFQPFATGWTGADGLYSIALGPQRHLWLFGDTLIGSRQGAGRTIASMPRNSLAVQTNGQWRFFWRSGPKGEVFAAPDPQHWFWPGPGTLYQGKLYLLLPEFAPDAAGGVFGFRHTGLYLVTVSNPDADPADWRIDYRALNWGTQSGKEGPTAYSVAALVVSDQLYVYGYADRASRRQARLLRIALADLASGQSESYWDGRGWSPQAQDAVPLFDGFHSEASIHWFAALNKGHGGYGLIYSAPNLYSQILMRTAPAPTGPWSEAQQLYQIPETRPGVFCYAAKHHPHLARTQNELVLGYACNASDPGRLESDGELYLPRFVRLPLPE